MFLCSYIQSIEPVNVFVFILQPIETLYVFVLIHSVHGASKHVHVDTSSP